MNKLYLIAGALIAALLLCIGTFAYGVKVGSDHQIAVAAKTEKARTEEREAIAQVIAKSVAQIKIINQTSKQVLEREIRIVPDYSACRHSPDGLRSLNSALTNEPIPAGGGVVPKADPAR